MPQPSGSKSSPTAKLPATQISRGTQTPGSWISMPNLTILTMLRTLAQSPSGSTAPCRAIQTHSSWLRKRSSKPLTTRAFKQTLAATATTTRSSTRSANVSRPYVLTKNSSKGNSSTAISNSTQPASLNAYYILNFSAMLRTAGILR
jgi:hypothetical protein